MKTEYFKVCSCVGFSDTACDVLAANGSALIGVGEAPMHEIAGLFSPAVRRFQSMGI